MYDIPLSNLLYLIAPLLFVAYFYGKWVQNTTVLLYAAVRMAAQLIAVGYVLTALFSQRHWWLGVLVLGFMLVIASFITLRNTTNKTPAHYLLILSTTAIVGLLNLVLVVAVVLNTGTAYKPQVLIPLAGMVFYTIMNTLSLAIERFEGEYRKQQDFVHARQSAFKAAMIPPLNALLAVGLVSLPGMMTGQILSGVAPLIAVRYQMVIMVLSVSGGGGSVVVYFLLREHLKLPP